ncbi:hypothetical protein I4U23_010758 [Adineta vaga]|nr:hypothetical protein I4U23_010758 [Adineta vaga]
MKNFQHIHYGRTLLAYCDSCYAILDAEKHLYYQCLTCNNYTVCMNCISFVQNKHVPYHRFIPRRGIPKEMAWIHMNMGLTCDICFQVNFSGHRFKCLDCPDFDVCQRCCPIALRSHRLRLESNPQKVQMNRQLLAQRTICVLTDPTSLLFGQQKDYFTGWTLDEAKIILAQHHQSQKQQGNISNEKYSNLPQSQSQQTNRTDKQGEEHDQEKDENNDNDNDISESIPEEEEEEEEHKNIKQNEEKENDLWQDIMRRLKEIRIKDKSLDELGIDDY